jgi:hypothetical protein
MKPRATDLVPAQRSFENRFRRVSLKPSFGVLILRSMWVRIKNL